MMAARLAASTSNNSAVDWIGRSECEHRWLDADPWSGREPGRVIRQFTTTALASHPSRDTRCPSDEWLYPGFPDPDGGHFGTAAGQMRCRDGPVLSCHGGRAIERSFVGWAVRGPERFLRVDGLLSCVGTHLTGQHTLSAPTYT